MRKKLAFFITALSFIVFFQACYEKSGDKVITFEFTLGGLFVESFQIKPKGTNTTEIKSGKYNFNGSINKGGQSQAAGKKGETYPKKLFIRLLRKKSKDDGYQDLGINAKKINIKLKINPKTGNIPAQTINIRKTMILDPKKNEYLSVLMKCKRGTINTGDKLSIFYSKEEDSLNDFSHDFIAIQKRNFPKRILETMYSPWRFTSDSSNSQYEPETKSNGEN